MTRLARTAVLVTPFVLVGGVPAAQAVSGPPLQSSGEVGLSEYEYGGHFRLIAATGELIPEPLGGPLDTSASGSVIQPMLSCGDFITNAFTNLDASSAYVDGAVVFADSEYVDWGVITADAASDIVTEFRIGYSTVDLDVSAGGVGTSLDFSFYSGYEGPCTVGTTTTVDEVARFSFTGLPGWSGSGLPQGYFITVDLRGGLEFVLPEGPFGLGLHYPQTTSRRQSGLVLSLAGSPLGDLDNPDGNGQTSRLDIFEPDAATGTCTDSRPVNGDATTGLPVGSYYLLLRKVDASSSSPATATLRNDAFATNPVALLAGGTPVLGADFSFVAASTGPGEQGVFLAGFAAPTEVQTPFGVLLVDVTDPGGELLAPAGLAGPHAYAAGFAAITTSLPPNVDLCEFDLYVQGVQFGTALRLTNAVDLTFGVR